MHATNTPGPMASALVTFRGQASGGWSDLPFLGAPAERVAAAIDARSDAGAQVLPAPGDVFAALAATQPESVRAVILGQDPYPTPGDAHGLAFSYRGGRRLPQSLRVILTEALGFVPSVGAGDLTGWAEQGVLLLNTALTVEAGKAGAHIGLGWEELAGQVVEHVSALGAPTAFLLWGGKARAMAPLVDRGRHLVLECGHPSPLNRHRDFKGCGHFAKANEWLERQGRGRIDWMRTGLGGAEPWSIPGAQGRLAL